MREQILRDRQTGIAPGPVLLGRRARNVAAARLEHDPVALHAALIELAAGAQEWAAIVRKSL